MQHQELALLSGLLVVAFFVMAPISSAIAVIDPLAERGVNADLCHFNASSANKTCQAQTNSLETMLDLAMSIAPITAVAAGACYDALGGFRAGLLFVAVWCGALCAISIAPTAGALWAVATGIAGGAGGSLVQAMAYWHVRQLFGGGESPYYAMANTAFIVAFDTSGFFSIPLQRWTALTAVPLRLVFPVYAVAIAVPAALLLYYFRRFESASSVVMTAIGDSENAQLLTTPEANVQDGLVAMSNPPERFQRIAAEVCTIVRTEVFAAHALQIATVLSVGAFIGSVIGTVYQRVGATPSEVSMVRTVAPYATGTIALWSLVVGRITGRLGPRRGIFTVDVLQAGTALVGTVLVVCGLAYASIVAVTFGYFFLSVWRATGFPLLNLLWPVVFGATSPRGIGVAGGLASTLGGAASALVGTFSAHAVHSDPSRYAAVLGGMGGCAVASGVLAALSMWRWRGHDMDVPERLDEKRDP